MNENHDRFYASHWQPLGLDETFEILCISWTMLAKEIPHLLWEDDIDDLYTER